MSRLHAWLTARLAARRIKRAELVAEVYAQRAWRNEHR